jgi:hypothetical protein
MANSTHEAGAALRYLFYLEHNYSFSVLRPLEKAIRARGGRVAWLPVGEEVDDAGFTAGDRVLRTVPEAVAWAPRAVFVPGNQVPRFIPGVKVEVFHGLNSGKRRLKDGEQYHFIIRGLFDLYCTHGPNTTDRFRELAEKHGHFDVAETGWCKLDPLFDGTYAPRGGDQPLVYFASTHSPRMSAAPVLVDTIAELAQAHDWRWVANFHAKMDPEVVARYRALDLPNFEYVETHDPLPLLARADVMLCDTSSILLEFAMLRKPVVTFRNVEPKPFQIDVTRPDEVGPALERALSRPPELEAALDDVIRETHPWADGRSGERILDATEDLIARGTGHLSRKPANVIRHWKMRRQLGWYGRG